jgi:molybdopterin synthase sulfur carrier subunit
MIIRFFAFIRDYTGTKETTADCCGTLRELLQSLCGRYGRRFRDNILDGDEISKDIIILVNGRHIEHLEGLETRLYEKDEISIFPRVAGG